MSPRIVIVGGGFSGAAFALHLLRDAPELAADIHIIEPRAALGRGLAYDTGDPVHRINVAAARMAVFSEDPAHLDRWLRTTGRLAADPQAEVDGVGLFPRRGDVAAYMADLLTKAARVGPGRLRHVRATATRISRQGRHGWQVSLNSGARLSADIVVLATGHPAIEPPAPLRAIAGDPRMIADPWVPDALADIAPDARVLIVGTGLTMADVLASLRARGHRAAVLALSRRGLVPRPRTRLAVAAAGHFPVEPGLAASTLLRRVRAAITAGVASGRPWEDTIDTLRANGRAIWAALTPQARRRLLRHVQPYWDVHRYQIAPQVDAVLRADLSSDQLQVLRGRLLGAAGSPGQPLRVLYNLPRAMAPAEIACDAVIVCTGPAHRTALACNPALLSLALAGRIRDDALGLGIAVDDAGQALDAAGQGQSDLLVAGPPARGTWGELMGLPQVSQQPREVAAALAARLMHPAAPILQEVSA